MRLTDRPKRLSEIRPDVVWPAELQAVLDRALERDAAKRYQTASEFGRDFERAAAPLTGGAAAVSGAQPVAAPAAIPPTRVGAGNQAAEPALPTTQQPVAGPSAAPVRSPSRVPLVAAAIGVLAIAGTAAGFVVLRRGDRKAETPVTLGAPVPSQQRPATPQPLASGSETPPGAAGSSPSSSNVSRPTSSATRVQNVAAVLDSLEPLTDPLHDADSLSAIRALRRLDQLTAIPSDEDRIRATILRAEAEMLVGRQSDACSLLRAIRADAQGTNRKRIVTLLDTCR